MKCKYEASDKVDGVRLYSLKVGDVFTRNPPQEWNEETTLFIVVNRVNKGEGRYVSLQYGQVWGNVDLSTIVYPVEGTFIYQERK